MLSIIQHFAFSTALLTEGLFLQGTSIFRGQSRSVYFLLCDLIPRSPWGWEEERTHQEGKTRWYTHNFYLLHPHFGDKPAFKGLLELPSMVKTEEPSQGCPVSVQDAGAETTGGSLGSLARLMVHFTPALLERRASLPCKSPDVWSALWGVTSLADILYNRPGCVIRQWHPGLDVLEYRGFFSKSKLFSSTSCNW